VAGFEQRALVSLAQRIVAPYTTYRSTVHNVSQQCFSGEERSWSTEVVGSEQPPRVSRTHPIEKVPPKWPRKRYPEPAVVPKEWFLGTVHKTIVIRVSQDYIPTCFCPPPTGTKLGANG
jgi:hypothetical protein